MQGLLSNFKIGLKIRLAVTLLQVLLRGGKLGNIKVLDQLRFPCFLASFAFVVKLVLCVMRRLRGRDDGLNGFVSGFLAGLTLLINNDAGTKKMFALYLLSRAYSATHTMAESRGLPKLWQHQHVGFMVIVNVLFVWLYLCEHDTKVAPSFFAACNHFYASHKDKNDHIMLKILQ